MLSSKQKTALTVNLGLLGIGLLMCVSGLVIMIHYHMGHEGKISTTDLCWGLDYDAWSLLHKIAIVVFSLLAITHIVLHWVWYKTIVRKQLLGKNKQVITLSILFILVAITGLLPWCIHLLQGNEITRKVFLEIHDKLGIILFIYLLLHVIKRFKWFVSRCKN